MSEIRSNTPDEVKLAIEESSKNPESPFICLYFYHSIIPPALYTAKQFDKIRKNFSSDTVGQIFIIDVIEYQDFAAQYNVIPTPAVCILWKGNPLLIRRPGWDDSNKILGCLKDDDWLSILRFVAGLPKNEDRRFLSVNIE